MPDAPRYYSAIDVRAALPMQTAIAAMRDAFLALADGSVDMPARTALTLPTGATLLVMPSALKSRPAFATKLVTVTPQNRGTARPVIQAVVTLFDGTTGEPSAIIEGTSLTAIRTGAASGLATDVLARRDARTLAILGAGAQARTQLEAVRAVRPIESVAVWSRTRENAERFAAEIGPIARVAHSAADAARGAHVVCCATPSTEPLLRFGDVESGAHINAIGSFTPSMQELDAELLSRAHVVVDQRAAALEEAGEIIAAIQKGLLNATDLAELGTVLSAPRPAEPGRAITVFKSVGLAVQDLFAALAIVSRT